MKNAEIHALYWKKESKVSLARLPIEVFFLPNISPPNIGPSNLFFVFIYAQGILTGFYGISEGSLMKMFGIFQIADGQFEFF